MFATLAFVWEFWTWETGNVVPAALFGVVYSFMIFAALTLNKGCDNPLLVMAGVLSIVIGFGLSFLVFGSQATEDQLDNQTTQETQQGIAHAFEASGHEVTGVYINLVKPSDSTTIRISNSCGEWEYELLDNYSESDLRVDPVSVQRIEQGHQADSREFCPPPHEEWLLLLD